MDRPSLAPSEFSVEDDVDAAIDMQEAEVQWSRIHSSRGHHLERFEKSILSEVEADEEAEGLSEAFHQIRKRQKGSGRLPKLADLNRLYGVSKHRVRTMASQLLKQAASRRNDRDSVATVRTNLTGSSDNNDYEDDFENDFEEEASTIPAVRLESWSAHENGAKAKRSTSPEQVRRARVVEERREPSKRGSSDRNGVVGTSTGMRRSGKLSTMWIQANQWRLGEKIGSGSFGVSLLPVLAHQVNLYRRCSKVSTKATASSSRSSGSTW